MRLPFLLLFLSSFNLNSQEVTNTEKNLLFNPFSNKFGISQTVIDQSQLSVFKQSSFFKTFGTNGRNCFSCHRPDQGWTITPEKIQERFVNSQGLDPIFVNFDGSNCREANSKNFAQRKKDYSLLLNKGLIRVDLKIPVGADFSLLKMDDPYRCTKKEEIAVYRRPLPTTNLRFLTGVMWDARESSPNKTLRESLLQQAADATTGHAQAANSPSENDLKSIVDFEMALHTAQIYDDNAKNLNLGVNGGPAFLAKQAFAVGVNDPLNPQIVFNEKATNLYTNWETENGRKAFLSPNDLSDIKKIENQRTSIARGQNIFSTKKFFAKDVMGLNDVINVPSISISCTTCHNTPNVGNHSVPFPVDLGLSSESKRTADLPLYTFKCANGSIVKTTDPGRAMITGKCKDLNKMKGAVLRALAPRAPYFHNGSAASLEKVVDFYNERFTINLNDAEKLDLVAFLKSL